MKKIVLLPLLFFQTLFAQNITLTDIWQQYDFYAKSANEFNWLTDSTYMDVSQDVSINKIGKKEKLNLFKGDSLSDSISISDVIHYEADKYIVFTANSEQLYRRSHKVYIYKYDLQSNQIINDIKQKVYNPSISPDKSKLAYTRENNLYVLNLKTWQEQQLTTDGKWNFVINGRSDWVYEEEFGFTQAFHWVTANKIAYLRFDESQVPTYDMQLWGRGLYPTNYSYKYPKAGEQNSKVSLHTIDLTTSTTNEILTTNNEYEYISKLGVTKKEGVFYYIKMNRLQNKLVMTEHNVLSGEEEIVYSESSDKYVELPNGPYYYSKGFIIDSYKSGNKHFYKIESGAEKDLTKGAFDVTDYKYYDEAEKCVYFTALFDNSHTQTLCISKGKKVKKILDTDLWVDASLSPNGKYAIVTTSSLQEPYKSNLYDLDKLEIIEELKNNNSIKIKMATLDLGETSFFKVKAKEGHEIPCIKILPPNFDENKKYPVLMHCYGGPGHQVVTNKWNPFDYWYHQMIAQQGCIVVLADGRGTDGNGTQYRQASYGQFGKYEHEDQVTVTNYFRSKEYVDSTKVGIWGWSYGGYLSSLCLMKSPKVFSTAIAVAPVTNWRFYDNIYTERYMGLPKDNIKGYYENSPTTYAGNLSGKYLLIHGTADDNVHVQNAISMQQGLLRNNKQFEMFYYPDKNHGIYGGYTRYNLYQKMFTFIQQNLINDAD